MPVFYPQGARKGSPSYVGDRVGPLRRASVRIRLLSTRRLTPQQIRTSRDGLTFLDRLPSFRVITKERKPRPANIHCRNCGEKSDRCPSCGTSFVRSAEKGIDTHVVTDLLSLAWQEAFDVAVLLSSDADFVPAVIRIQEKGLKVINASWAGHGHEVKKACWGSFDLDLVARELCRYPSIANGFPHAVLTLTGALQREEPGRVRGPLLDAAPRPETSVKIAPGLPHSFAGSCHHGLIARRTVLSRWTCECQNSVVALGLAGI